VVRRTSLGHAQRAGATRDGDAPRFIAAVLLAWLLPGCPLSDGYFVDAQLGAGGTGSAQGGTGARSVGGASGTGGAVVSGGRDGKGGREGTGGKGALAAGCSTQQYDGHSYVLCVSSDGDDLVTANVASDRCAALGPLHLAWVESAAENTFLKSWIEDTAPDDGVVWMGASDERVEGDWFWGRGMDAQQFYRGTADDGGAYMDRFEAFGEGQPGSSRGLDEDCGAFDARVEWDWSDRECSEAMVGFVCEEQRPMPP